MVGLFKSKFFLFIELLILVGVVGAYINITEKEESIQEEISYLERKVAGAKSEHWFLQERIHEAADDSYKELQAKRKLNYKRPEETVFVFYEEQEKEEEQLEIDLTRPIQEPSNPQKWWNYFFHGSRT